MINDMSLRDIEAEINSAHLSDLPLYRIFVLRNITVEPIKSLISFYLLKLGFKAEIEFGNFDNILQDAYNVDFDKRNVDLVIIFSNILSVSSSIFGNNFLLEGEEITKKEIEKLHQYYLDTIEAIREKSNCNILISDLEDIISPIHGIYDNQIQNGQSALINEFNREIKTSIINQFSNVNFVNMNSCLTRVGINNYLDLRYWYRSKAPYTASALKEISFEISKFLRIFNGKAKKCIILDCDNTLWGGIIGEDGINKIKLGPDYPGSSFYDFQKEILNLYNRGIIIALCSKNNEMDVMNVLNNHSSMIIKSDHISISKINWKDKASNIREIASDLNIGLDSCVFVDDSDFETNLIKVELPEVEVLHVPVEKAYQNATLIRNCGLFEHLSISNEDKNRTETYKQNIQRNILRTKTKNLRNYYKSLEMETQVFIAKKIDVIRASQMTQRTNQFNLTTKRYSESDIENFLNSSAYDVILINLKDRFGVLGIIGMAIIEYKNTFAEIDTFLFSCRALGRELENLFLKIIMKRVEYKKYDLIKSTYISTKKNLQVQEFYEKNGFSLLKSNDKKVIKHYSLNLSQIDFSVPFFIKTLDINFKWEKNG